MKGLKPAKKTAAKIKRSKEFCFHLNNVFQWLKHKA